jgi:hypothetical protein
MVLVPGLVIDSGYGECSKVYFGYVALKIYPTKVYNIQHLLPNRERQ